MPIPVVAATVGDPAVVAVAEAVIPIVDPAAHANLHLLRIAPSRVANGASRWSRPTRCAYVPDRPAAKRSVGSAARASTPMIPGNPTAIPLTN